MLMVLSFLSGSRTAPMGGIVCDRAKKTPHAVALGRKGGKKSATGRMKKLTAERGREIVQKAVAARWRKEKGDR
jgi:hypothetical protein